MSGFGGFPTAFWGNTGSIPTTSNGIEFDLVNATNGQSSDFNSTDARYAQVAIGW
jgi:hypothetical protein